MNKMMIGIVFFCLSTVGFAEPRLTMSTGLDYSSGKYGQAESTKITYIPLTAKVETDRWIFKATLPYIQIEGPANVTPDSRVVVTGSRAVTSKESGLGDVVASATYAAYTNPNAKLYLDVGAKVKLPTADENKGLGSGKADYAIFTDVFRTFGKTTLLGTLGYKILGDPTGIDLNNVFYGSAGLSHKLTSVDSIGAVVDFRQRTSDSGSALREYSVFYSHKFDSRYKLQTYLVAGDTTSSVDFGGGAILAVGWD